MIEGSKSREAKGGKKAKKDLLPPRAQQRHPRELLKSERREREKRRDLHLAALRPTPPTL